MVSYSPTFLPCASSARSNSFLFLHTIQGLHELRFGYLDKALLFLPASFIVFCGHG